MITRLRIDGTPFVAFVLGVLFMAVVAIGIEGWTDNGKVFKPVRGTIGLKGPVVVEETDITGKTRRVDPVDIVDQHGQAQTKAKREVRITVKDSKGKILSEKQIESKVKGRSR